MTNNGEKVFSAYIMLLHSFVLLLGEKLELAKQVYSLSALLLSMLTNGGLTSSRYAVTIHAEKKVSSFFLIFFFVWVERAWWSARGAARGMTG